MPITLFLISDYSEHGQYFWWLAADYLVKHTRVEHVTLDERIYDLTQKTGRAALTQDIDFRVRTDSQIGS